MARQIVDIKGLTEHLPFTLNQIYKAVRDPVNPLPHKKWGTPLINSRYLDYLKLADISDIINRDCVGK